jgi:hypothetical protein
MSTDSPQRFKANYASSMASEIAANIVLSHGETIHYSQLVRERKNWLIARPRLLVITQLRLIFLEHNLLSSDWINEIPRPFLTHVANEKSVVRRWVTLAYSDNERTRSFQIQPMRRRVSEKDIQELLVVLNAFHGGQLDSLP